MNKTKYIIIEWPYTQKLMECPDFNEHAYLINDDHWLVKHGSQSYFIEEDWFNKIKNI